MIHAVTWSTTRETRSAELLGSAVRQLALADAHGLKPSRRRHRTDLRLPAEQRRVMLRAALDTLRGETGLERVVFQHGNHIDLFVQELKTQTGPRAWAATLPIWQRPGQDPRVTATSKYRPTSPARWWASPSRAGSRSTSTPPAPPRQHDYLLTW
jgi:hypothetical protein